MPDIYLNSSYFSLMSPEPGSPLEPENPINDSGDIITSPGDSGTILGPVVQLPGWPDLNNLQIWNPELPNPNLAPPPTLNIPVELPLYGDSIVPQPQILNTPSISDLYGNFEMASTVPEPATMTLVVLGCAAAAMSKRFRRRRN